MADAFSTTSRPVRPDSFMKRAGRALVGFGEGYMGRGQEYLEGLRAERERKNLQLADASVKDAIGVRRAIVNNDPQEAISILVDRANILDRMGEDSSDTLALRDLIASNNQAAALSEVDSFLSAAQRRGMIAAPAPIPSSQITTGPSGEMGVVTRDPTTQEYGFTTISGMADKPFDQSQMTVSEGRYVRGPYIGYTPQRIRELIDQGVIQRLGDPLPTTESRARPEPFRPPMRMPETQERPSVTVEERPSPATPRFVDPTMSAQEQEIFRQEQEDARLERERAEAEEARKVAQEGRAVREAEQEEEEAREKRTLAKNEMLMALGVLQGRLLNTNVYGDNVYNAATGPIEGRGDSASYLSMIPGGASMQQVQNFVDDFNNLNNLLTVGNLGRMSGVLSESDIALIRDAASGLQRTSDPELLKTRMRVIEGVILNRLKEQFGMSEQEIRQQLPQFSTASGSELDRLMEEAGVASGLN